MAVVETVKAVSQCFTSTSMSFVTLYCGYRHLIAVERAVHGRRRHSGDDVLASYCHLLPTDCISDVTGQYNWSACRGQRHCVHSLRHFNDTQHEQHCVEDQRLTYLHVSLYAAVSSILHSSLVLLIILSVKKCCLSFSVISFLLLFQ